ncbi:MAG: hypothetical protein ABI977_32950 [Acidobacteriota bacterium]
MKANIECAPNNVISFLEAYSFQLCLILALAFALSAPTFAQGQTYGDITIIVEAMHSNARYGGIGRGYAEFRATITNNSSDKTHRVEVEMGTYGDGREQVRRAVELSPHATSLISLFALGNRGWSREAAIIIDGERQNADVEIGENRIGSVGSRVSEGFDLLLSPNIFKSDLQAGNKLETVLQTSSGGVLISTQAYNFPFTEWSTNWLSYSRFSCVVIYADELNAAPEAVRSALMRYVERGGTLLVVGNWQVPPQWLPRQGLLKDDELSAEESKAEKENDATNVMLASGSSRPKYQKDLPLFYIGFGTVVVANSIDPSQIGINQWKRLRWNFNASRNPIDRFETLAGINQAFQVVERFGVPVRGLFALMLAFVIVIGPINLIWLARRKRKIWMLWTVPLIALVTCLAIASFSLFGEGWSATARTESLTLLDETAHRATTIGWVGFYSPITPSDGLHFSYDTELDPQLQSGWGGGRGGIGNTVDWTNDQHLASGWVLARVPAFFKLRKSETRRERLSIRQEANGTTTLVNGLGAPITDVWWADGNGKIHSAANVPAGAQASLKSTGVQAAGQASTLRDAFGQDWLAQFKIFTEQPQTVLMPNSYLAVLDGSPFVEEGLKNVKTRKARNLVYGIGAGGSQ